MLLTIIKSDDIETLCGISFALHSFSIDDPNNSMLENAGTVESLVALAQCGDRDTSFQACISIKYLYVCKKCRNIYISYHGLDLFLLLSSSDDLETKW